MKATLAQKAAALINVKTIVTFAVTFVFALLALRGDIRPDVTMGVVTMVYGFYFGTQKQRQEEK